MARMLYSFILNRTIGEVGEMRFLVAMPKDTHRNTFARYLNALYSRNAVLDPPEIEYSTDGVTALKLIQKVTQTRIPFDLVIIDQHMPIIEGTKISNVMTSDSELAKIPVIIFHPVAHAECMKAVKDSGAKMFLTCPLSLEIFKERITGMVDKMLRDEDENRSAQLEIMFSSRETMIKSEVRDGLYLQSLSIVRRIRKLAPWSVYGQLSEAKIQVGMNEFAEALPALQKIVQQHFDYKEAHKLLHHCYMRLGKRYAEIPELLLLLEKDSNSPELHLQLGDAYLRSGDYHQAMDRYKQVIQQYAKTQSPGFRAKSHVGLGKSLNMIASKESRPGLREDARKEFEEGRRLDPTLLSAYVNLAIVLREMGREDEARSVIEKISTVTPSSQEDWLSLFEMYLRDGELVKARAALDRALSVDTGSLKAMMDAGYLYMRQDMCVEAVKLFEQVVSVNPSDKSVYNCMGICKRRLGEYEAALDAYTSALQIDGTDASLYFNKGRVYEDMGDIEHAWECYEGALFLDPEMAEAETAIKNLSGKLCWMNDKGGAYSGQPN